MVHVLLHEDPQGGRASSRAGFRSSVGASLLQSHFGFGVPQVFENGDTMFVIERPRRSDGNAAAAIGKPNAKARSSALTRRLTAGGEEPNVSATAEMPPGSTTAAEVIRRERQQLRAHIAITARPCRDGPCAHEVCCGTRAASARGRRRTHVERQFLPSVAID